MATQMESTPRPNESRANSHSHNVYEDSHNVSEAQPEIASTIPIEVTRQDVEPLTDEQYRGRIAIAAYYLAEGRNFEPGHETEDWLAAESEVRSLGD
jgi:Protein of unknown function (DUF2934)